MTQNYIFTLHKILFYGKEKESLSNFGLHAAIFSPIAPLNQRNRMSPPEESLVEMTKYTETIANLCMTYILVAESVTVKELHQPSKCTSSSSHVVAFTTVSLD